MNKFYNKTKNVLFGSVLACISHLVAAQTITINTATVVTSFDPGLICGNNANPAGPGDTNDIVAVYDSLTSSSRPYNLQHANMLIRYGGGNPMNYYHWNSTGSYDANNYWVPSTTAYTPGFLSAPLYKGTTTATISNGTRSNALGQYSNITDGNTTTQWRSLSVLTTPQWVYTQFVGSNQPVNGVEIVWGSTYATHYLIQYYIGTTYTAPYEDSASTSWYTVDTVTNGTGGIDNRTFTAYTKKFWRIYMTASSGQGYSIAELYLKNNSTVVTSNTPSETSQTPTWASSMDPGSMNPNISIKPDEDFDFVTFMTWCTSIGAQPMLVVNFGTGTPHEAANWVRFCKNMGYTCKYWDIGNEMDGDWSCGGPIGINDYTTRYIQFADSMKAVDPTINICGPVMGINQNGLTKPILSYVPTSFLNDLKAVGKTSDCNVLSVHNFPKESPIDTLFNSVNYWNSWLPAVRNTIQADYGSANGIPIFASAYTTSGANVVDDQLVGGLWSSDYLMSFVKNSGNGAALYCIVGQLFNDAGDSLWGDFGCMEDGQLSAPYKFQPRSTYWGFYLLSNYFSIPGTGNNNLVSTTVTSAPKLDVYVNTRTDNKTALFVVNRDSLNAVTATINVSGFTPSSSATVYTFSAKNYLWHADSSSSYANPDNPPTDTTITTGSSFSAKFPAYSMTVIILSPQSTILPVQLLSFTATPEGSEVNLTWTTATETNNALFTIERSDDAENWQTVTTHPGAGNSTQPISYTAVDKTPFSGQSYYRLKQTDYDGNFTYSGIRPVTFAQPVAQMLLYPNPASTQVTLSYQLPVSNGIFQLYNTLGQLIKSSILNTNQGTIKEDVSNLPNGIYYYTLTVNGETQVTNKVVVIH